MSFSPTRFANQLPADSGDRSVQSINIDTVTLEVTATPTRIADLLEDAGFHTRWGFGTIEDAMGAVDAIVFLPRAYDVALRTKSADAAAFVRTVAAAETVYLPAVRLYGKFISGTAGSYQIDVLHSIPTLFD